MWTGWKRSSWCTRDTRSTWSTGEWMCCSHIFNSALKHVKIYVDVGKIREKSHYSFGTDLGATLVLLSGVTHTFLDNYPSACYWFPAVKEGVGGCNLVWLTFSWMKQQLVKEPKEEREGGLLAQVRPADCDRLLGAGLEAVIAPLFIQHKDSWIAAKCCSYGTIGSCQSLRKAKLRLRMGTQYVVLAT